MRTNKITTTREKYSSLRFLEEGKTDIFELYVERPGTLLVDLISCQGSAKLSYAVGNIKTLPKDIQEPKLSLDIKTAGERVYLRVKDEGAESDKADPLKPRSIYKISTRIETKNPWSVAVGKEGLVEWKQGEKENTGDVKFEGITLSGHDEASDKFHISYTILGVYHPAKLDTVAKCGTFDTNLEDYVAFTSVCENVKGSACTQNIRLPAKVKKGVKVSALVHARVTNLNTGDVRTVQYKPFLMTYESEEKGDKGKDKEKEKETEGIDPNSNGWVKYFLIVLAVLFFAALCFGGYLIYQHGQDAKKYQAELTTSLANARL
eukprot:TRINITY_DN2379_c0_g1_i1.p1 TRINITY_DN2379_c0_g1~~TRINITY_DN2379_c0_g1_i1.p1  ORF type:complete len:320 (+),score=83.96 TRINITY_DN2379_c0_g1_i1:1150-2109(+)